VHTCVAVHRLPNMSASRSQYYSTLTLQRGAHMRGCPQAAEHVRIQAAALPVPVIRHPLLRPQGPIRVALRTCMPDRRTPPLCATRTHARCLPTRLCHEPSRRAKPPALCLASRARPHTRAGHSSSSAAGSSPIIALLSPAARVFRPEPPVHLQSFATLLELRPVARLRVELGAADEVLARARLVQLGARHRARRQVQDEVCPTNARARCQAAGAPKAPREGASHSTHV